MKNILSGIKYIMFFCLVGIFVYGCGDSEEPIDEEILLLPYDSSKHIYGTFGQFDGSKWEVVIDPAVGKFSKIEETKEIFGGISGRLGAKELTAFDRNERIYIREEGKKEVVLQDLETFEEKGIELIDMELDKAVIFPQILRFGADQNELYLTDTDNSLWFINLENEKVSLVHNGLLKNELKYISSIFYNEETSNILVLGNDNSFNDFGADRLYLINIENPDSTVIIANAAIDYGFGFVQHPSDKNTFFYIQMTTEDKGFRLMKISLFEDIINVSQISQSDLAIDELSLYVQTIHTASNAYILRGGSNNIETPTNFLYSVDLSNGNLRHKFEIEEIGYFLKLAGE